jgi:hypothetical protein
MALTVTSKERNLGAKNVPRGLTRPAPIENSVSAPMLMEAARRNGWTGALFGGTVAGAHRGGSEVGGASGIAHGVAGSSENGGHRPVFGVTAMEQQ